MCVSVCACMRGCVGACVRACVCVICCNDESFPTVSEPMIVQEIPCMFVIIQLCVANELYIIESSILTKCRVVHGACYFMHCSEMYLPIDEQLLSNHI